MEPGAAAAEETAAAAPCTVAAAATRAVPDTAPPLLDEDDWDGIIEQMRSQDEARETLLKRIRDAQKLAKHAIYALHRGDPAAARRQLAEARGVHLELLPLVRRQPALRFGAYAAALEEYAEGVAFLVFLEEGRLARRADMAHVDVEEYLGGVLDMAGELNRYAVARATRRDAAAVRRCRDVADALMGRMLRLDLRNGALRKKFDGLKYTLRRMEQTLYELSLADAHVRAFEAAGARAGDGGNGGGGNGGGDGGDGGMDGPNMDEEET